MNEPTALSNFQALRELRDYEDLVRPAYEAFRAARLGVVDRLDLDALYAALQAYQAREDSHRKIATAVQATQVEGELLEAAAVGPTDATYRAVAALNAASSLVADALDMRDVDDVLAHPRDLGRLAELGTELADTYLVWLDEQATR